MSLELHWIANLREVEDAGTVVVSAAGFESATHALKAAETLKPQHLQARVAPTKPL